MADHPATGGKVWCFSQGFMDEFIPLTTPTKTTNKNHRSFLESNLLHSRPGAPPCDPPSEYSVTDQLRRFGSCFPRGLGTSWGSRVGVVVPGDLRVASARTSEKRYSAENGTFGHIFAWVNYKTYKKRYVLSCSGFPKKKKKLIYKWWFSSNHLGE